MLAIHLRLGIAFALVRVQEVKGHDQYDGSNALASSDLAPWPRRLRGVRGVLRSGRSDLPVLRQRRVRPPSSSARGTHSQHDEQQLADGRSREESVLRTVRYLN